MALTRAACVVRALWRVRLPLSLALLFITMIGVGLTYYFTWHTFVTEDNDAAAGFRSRFAMDLPGVYRCSHCSVVDAAGLRYAGWR